MTLGYAAASSPFHAVLMHHHSGGGPWPCSVCVSGLARIMPHNAKLYTVDPDKRESMPYEVLREQMRGYHASISFLDHQLGRLLDAFDRVRAGPSHLILLRTRSTRRAWSKADL